MLNNQLLDAALKVRQKAHELYSRFAVGAALLTEPAEIFTGRNIENVSVGLTICAERVAVVGAVAKDLNELLPRPKQGIIDPRQNV